MNRLSFLWFFFVAIVASSSFAKPVWAGGAPRIEEISVPAIQIGEQVGLIVEGQNLTPHTRLVLPLPEYSQSIVGEATPTRVEFQVTVAKSTPVGIYPLRVVTRQGISPALPLSVDSLPQEAFTPHVEQLPMALFGKLTGKQRLRTEFPGQAGQKVVVEVESTRLGSKLRPMLHLYDGRGVQVAWSRPTPRLSGDARLIAVLPEDGSYTVELHDALYRGKAPGKFRLKIGEFSYADLAFPLGVRCGSRTSIQLIGENLGWGTILEVPAGALPGIAPARWPTESRASGTPPWIVISDVDEILEMQGPAGQLQQLPSAPIAVNGRVAQPDEEDRYLLAVEPGKSLRVETLARAAGSPLDPVIILRDMQGRELARGDDQSTSVDPELMYEVPEGMEHLEIAVRDLLGRGGSGFVYRLAITPAKQPNFALTFQEDLRNIPRGGAALLNVTAERTHYDGPIEIEIPDLPPHVRVQGTRIPAGGITALLSLAASEESSGHALTRVVGTATVAGETLRRSAERGANAYSRQQPWFRSEVALAVAESAPLRVEWNLAEQPELPRGALLPLKVHVRREAAAQGPVRITLETSQVIPKKKIRENNQEKEVDDVDRALRILEESVIAAGESRAQFTLAIPPDLPKQPFALALRGELLADDEKKVLGENATEVRIGKPVPLVKVEVASAEIMTAVAGEKTPPVLSGYVSLAGDLSLLVTVKITGLPEHVPEPSLELPPGTTRFELPLEFPHGVPAGTVEGAQLLAVVRPDPENPDLSVSSVAVPISLRIMAGEVPPRREPRRIFEDEPAFLASLSGDDASAMLVASTSLSGHVSLRVLPGVDPPRRAEDFQRNIRRYPRAGEYRYLTFAWRKSGGGGIGLQLGHDGSWKAGEEKSASFQYVAGSGDGFATSAVRVADALPDEWIVVTRDLFKDFGQFTLTGLGFLVPDGEHAEFDRIYLGSAPPDFEALPAADGQKSAAE